MKNYLVTSNKMFYGLHTTKKSERDSLIAKPGEEIMIDPKSFHRSELHKAIVIEEGTDKLYEHDISDFLELCKLVEDPSYDPLTSKYYNHWSYKQSDVYTRVLRLRELISDIREKGIENPVHCTQTGERLDGSYRTKIALYLGIPNVKAIVHKIHWSEVDEIFIERMLRARWESSGKDYYEFSYGYKNWVNIPQGGPVYKENAERADIILPLIKGDSVLDVGCNEGYISLQAARKGLKVEGIDIDWNHIAYMNKLAFEFIDKKDIDAEFFEESIVDTTRTADTILMLNVLYHIPKDKQESILRKFKGKRIIFQCNLRKEREREKYYTSHPDDLLELLKRVGMKGEIILWRDKPIIIAE